MQEQVIISQLRSSSKPTPLNALSQISTEKYRKQSMEDLSPLENVNTSESYKVMTGQHTINHSSACNFNKEIIHTLETEKHLNIDLN